MTEGTKSITASPTVTTTGVTTDATPKEVNSNHETSLSVAKADFSITIRSQSTATLNAVFQRLMDVIHATVPARSIRGPIRLPKEDKIHSRRVDIKFISETQLRSIAEQSGVKLSDMAGEDRIQDDGLIVSFDIE
ncbi:hypothetical protein BX616_001626 [Lobosporangium transversale]|nr:hypothetical protein BX616_001626 [Lobosporangium transversale]